MKLIMIQADKLAYPMDLSSFMGRTRHEVPLFAQSEEREAFRARGVLNKYKKSLPNICEGCYIMSGTCAIASRQRTGRSHEKIQGGG